ncbi:MAG TPA: hypothetical protein VJ912_04165 [Candidatus Nanoarchaeia archaeon]|nr:hypothetical protein [Candidatus Nanoarchaeia archaeon]
MKSLVRKLFYPKKDYVRIFESFNDEDSLNEFFYEVNKKGGRIIRIQETIYTEQNTSFEEKGYNSGEFAKSINPTIHDKTLVHYRCHEKIDCLLQAEKGMIKKAEEEKIKHYKERSKKAVKELKKQEFEKNENYDSKKNHFNGSGFSSSITVENDIF